MNLNIATGCKDLLMGGEIADLFLNNPGDIVFKKLADAIGSRLDCGAAAFAWTDTWGSYAVSIQGSKITIRLQADDWGRLAGDAGWSAELVRIQGLNLGERGPQTILAVPLREKNSVIGFIGIEEHPGAAEKQKRAITYFQDITENLQSFMSMRIGELRRESMRQMTSEALAKSEKTALRDFIEESKDAIYIADSLGSILMINKSGEEMLGVQKSDIIGYSFAKFCPFSLDRDYFMERLFADGFVKDFELTFQRPDRSNIFVTETATVTRTADGSVSEIHGIIRDITERLESQRVLWRANVELADINARLKQTQIAMVQQEKLASIGQLAAGIAHEINNPLGFLMSNIGTLKKISGSMAAIISKTRESADAETRALMEKANLDFFLEDLPVIFNEMDDGFKRISEIVKNLRSFARSGENEGRTSYNLNEGVEQTLIIARNETRFVADVETRLSPLPFVTVNAGEINQVILNILVNAAQAIGTQKKKDRGRIVITTSADDKNIILEIADDGPGISEAAAKRLFEPFFTTKEPGKGTGLGLSISWDIITRKHGGTLSFAPRDGGGTVFKITIPIAPRK